MERATTIRNKLKQSFPDVMKRTRVIGKGFSQNIVGTGSDDEHDALDRRVELVIVDCTQ